MENREYVLTQDTNAIVEKIINKAVSTKTQEVITQYFQELRGIIAEAFPGITIRTFEEASIEKSLTQELSRQLSGLEDKVVICCLDRFLLREFEQERPEIFIRLGITRTINGRKEARQGNLSLEEQISRIRDRTENREIILIDDGIFEGGTMSEVIKLLLSQGCNPTNKITFISNGNIMHTCYIYKYYTKSFRLDRYKRFFYFRRQKVYSEQK
jgi:hypothetical protein